MTEQADLVLKGGRIIDPESGLDEIQDIAFKDGKVSALADSLATMPAKQVHDVSGKIISPGLIDLHTHVYWGCLLYTSPSPRDRQKSRMPSSA